MSARRHRAGTNRLRNGMAANAAGGVDGNGSRAHASHALGATRDRSCIPCRGAEAHPGRRRATNRRRIADDRGCVRWPRQRVCVERPQSRSMGPLVRKHEGVHCGCSRHARRSSARRNRAQGSRRVHRRPDTRLVWQQCIDCSGNAGDRFAVPPSLFRPLRRALGRRLGDASSVHGLSRSARPRDGSGQGDEQGARRQQYVHVASPSDASAVSSVVRRR